MAGSSRESPGVIAAALEHSRDACDRLGEKDKKKLQPMMIDLLDTVEARLQQVHPGRKPPVPDRHYFLTSLTSNSRLRPARADMYAAVDELYALVWPVGLDSTARSKKARLDPEYRIDELLDNELRIGAVVLEREEARLDALEEAEEAAAARARLQREQKEVERLAALSAEQLAAEVAEAARRRKGEAMIAKCKGGCRCHLDELSMYCARQPRLGALRMGNGDTYVGPLNEGEPESAIAWWPVCPRCGHPHGRKHFRNVCGMCGHSPSSHSSADLTFPPPRRRGWRCDHTFPRCWRTACFDSQRFHNWALRGTMTYANGDVYEGEWRRGKREGRGIMTYANGETQLGLWAADELTAPLPLSSVAEWERTDDVGKLDFQQRPRSPTSSVVTDAQYERYMQEGAASDDGSVWSSNRCHSCELPERCGSYCYSPECVSYSREQALKYILVRWVDGVRCPV